LSQHIQVLIGERGESVNIDSGAVGEAAVRRRDRNPFEKERTVRLQVLPRVVEQVVRVQTVVPLVEVCARVCRRHFGRKRRHLLSVKEPNCIRVVVSLNRVVFHPRAPAVPITCARTERLHRIAKLIVLEVHY